MNKPFSLSAMDGKSAGWFSRWARRPLECALRMDELNAQCAAAARGGAGAGYFRAFLENRSIGYRISAADRAAIPARGSVLAVANHPFGGIDGVILGALLSEIRPDVKIMANFVLAGIEPLKQMFIFVDPFGGERAARANLRGLRQAIDWLNQGGLLAMFPAGTVSHLHARQRRVIDPIWSDTVARLIHRTGAAALPIHFSGRNSVLFQLAGVIHSRLRTALLPRELLNKRQMEIEVRAAKPTSADHLSLFDSERAMTDHLRRRVDTLGHRDAPRPLNFVHLFQSAHSVVPPVNPSWLVAQIDALPQECLLLESGDQRVFLAEATQMPAVMQEIGRLREITFRQTGEGTGKAIDLDEFDAHYLHLFVWNAGPREIVGAYRLGLTDQIIPRRGTHGIYVSTLFQLQPALWNSLTPAIELGRSFVRLEYQRGFAPLMLLWKGIGRLLARRPQYRILFGPVSISNSYQAASRQILAGYLSANHFDTELAAQVRSYRPFSVDEQFKLNGATLDQTSQLISEIEPDGKGVPVLIRQYLRLGGTFIGFNIDPKFSSTLDGLVYLDLLRAPRRVLDKYMTAESAERFLSHHVGRFCEPTAKT